VEPHIDSSSISSSRVTTC